MNRARTQLEKVKTLLGHEAKRSLGQNFLVSDHVIEKIIAAAARFQPDVIFEVGPGCGALTVDLEQISKELVLIELDKTLAEYWRSEGKNVIEVDALRWDWPIQNWPGRRIFVSNLPYQISSSILIERSMDQPKADPIVSQPKADEMPSRPPLDGMVLMFQKEVAQKIKSKLGNDDYGFLSVVAQTFWDIELVLEAGPRDFDPSPKIASRVLSFNPRQVELSNRRDYLRFLKSCFLHPRKKMISSLVEGVGQAKPRVLDAMLKVGLTENTRAAELRLQQFLDLYRHIRSSAADDTSASGDK